MMELAGNADAGSLLKTREIAERQNIPLKYLEQIINTLKKHDLVVSTRGSEGGYRLARSPGEITLYDILRALEGDLSIMDRDDEMPEEQGLFWRELETSVQRLLEITLTDFLRKNHGTQEGLMYYI
jgi:Rrf2 family cysteine metabolism transcriptional repressor